MSKYPFLDGSTPKKCKKQIKRVLDAHPNARKECEAGRIGKAATMLAADNYLTTAHWLVRYCAQRVHA